jgi:hypothetical protein
VNFVAICNHCMLLDKVVIVTHNVCVVQFMNFFNCVSLHDFVVLNYYINLYRCMLDDNMRIIFSLFIMIYIAPILHIKDMFEVRHMMMLNIDIFISFSQIIITVVLEVCATPHQCFIYINFYSVTLQYKLSNKFLCRNYMHIMSCHFLYLYLIQHKGIMLMISPL